MTQSTDTSSPPPSSAWQEIALALCRAPGVPGAPAACCPACHANAVTAAWHLVDLASRQAMVDLRCSKCGATANLRMALPAEAPAFYPMEQAAAAGKAMGQEIAAIFTRMQKYAQSVPMAAFTNDPRWAQARWSATTFRWHPTSDAPPIMGLVFDQAAPAHSLFGDLIAKQGNLDRSEELRISIIEDNKPSPHPGYSVHLSPNLENPPAQAPPADAALIRSILPLLGQWNRMYPTAESPGTRPLLPQFKEEFAKHKEFLLAPVTTRPDGQKYVDVKLGIVKKTILFRTPSEIPPNDIDALAPLLPQLIPPKTT